MCICLSVCQQHSSKTNDPKVFKLGTGNDLGTWFGVERSKVKVTGSITLHNHTSFQNSNYNRASSTFARWRHWRAIRRGFELGWVHSSCLSDCMYEIITVSLRVRIRWWHVGHRLGLATGAQITDSEWLITSMMLSTCLKSHDSALITVLTRRKKCSLVRFGDVLLSSFSWLFCHIELNSRCFWIFPLIPFMHWNEPICWMNEWISVVNTETKQTKQNLRKIQSVDRTPYLEHPT